MYQWVYIPKDASQRFAVLWQKYGRLQEISRFCWLYDLFPQSLSTEQRHGQSKELIEKQGRIWDVMLAKNNACIVDEKTH